MNSSLIGRIEKAKRYSEERHRLRFKSFDVDFQGDNDAHTVDVRRGGLALHLVISSPVEASARTPWPWNASWRA